MTRSRSARSSLTVLTVLLLATPASAGDAAGDLGIQGGLLHVNNALKGSGPDTRESNPALGLRGRWFFDDHWALHADGLFSSVESARFAGDASWFALRSGLEFLYPEHASTAQFFGNVGLGLVRIDPDDGDSFNRAFQSWGLGQRIRLNDALIFHWELRHDATLGDAEDDVIDQQISAAQYLVGVSWALGAEPREARRTAAPRAPSPPATPKPPARPVPDDRDSDGDGIIDRLDRCPGTPKGTAVNADGCPKAAKLFQEGRASLTLENVSFETSSATVTAGSRSTLDRIAASLKAWPEVRVEIGGHTDSQGAAAANLALSTRRAQAVRDYLVRQGVKPSQLEVKGYGETRPVADNATAAGRERNRRVELKRIG